MHDQKALIMRHLVCVCVCMCKDVLQYQHVQLCLSTIGQRLEVDYQAICAGPATRNTS